MGFWTINNSKWAYRLDFAIYGVAVIALAGVLVLRTPVGLQWLVLAYALAGLLAWTGVEYVLHRFVLHGLQPFTRWHEAHHERPVALICSSTFLSAGLIVLLVFLPAFWALEVWRASALTLGVVAGYVLYAATHHALHHWRMTSPWLQQRKLWHARHHHHAQGAVCFGVTNAVWDRVFGTAYPKEK
jgi:sterol desaturase/sphingolipid hydroxylase (fatty acid hydroxylase superfamily)